MESHMCFLMKTLIFWRLNLFAQFRNLANFAQHCSAFSVAICNVLQLNWQNHTLECEQEKFSGSWSFCYNYQWKWKKFKTMTKVILKKKQIFAETICHSVCIFKLCFSISCDSLMKRIFRTILMWPLKSQDFSFRENKFILS